MMNAGDLGVLMERSLAGDAARNGLGVMPKNTQEAQKAAQDFEAMFLGQMMEAMFGESIGDEAFGDKDTRDVYKGLMMDAYGKEIARSGGIGIAAYVQRELLKLQEG